MKNLYISYAYLLYSDNMTLTKNIKKYKVVEEKPMLLLITPFVTQVAYTKEEAFEKAKELREYYQNL